MLVIGERKSQEEKKKKKTRKAVEDTFSVIKISEQKSGRARVYVVVPSFREDLPFSPRS